GLLWLCVAALRGTACAAAIARRFLVDPKKLRRVRELLMRAFYALAVQLSDMMFGPGLLEIFRQFLDGNIPAVSRFPNAAGNNQEHRNSHQHGSENRSGTI